MSFQLEEVFDVLERTPGVLERMLAGLPPRLLHANEGPETWSPHQIVGHLIHGEETDWIPRARIVLEHGTARAFEPFDRVAMLAKFGAQPIDELLERFRSLRAESLVTLRAWRLGPAELARRGRHPELGEVTLAQLLATWAVHDHSHVAQISRVLVRSWRADVGPWSAYFSLLG